MTASLQRRAGGDRPRRGPAGKRLVRRAAALACTAAVTVGLLAGSSAQAQTAAPPPLPTTMVPGTPKPPAPPALPGRKGKRAKPKKSKGLPNRDRGGKPVTQPQLQASCSPFDHTQTYEAWGPAVFYGEPVTVAYAAERCSTPNGSALDLNVHGTATVTNAAGTTLGTSPFSVVGTWNEPKNSVGWPPTWWECGVAFADYTWLIEGVYTFHVAATNGLWNLDITTEGTSASSVHWSHNGCA